MDYRARFYDPRLGRFIQADTLVPVPANPQSWNRYTYVLNSPLRYSDPSGHRECDLTCQMMYENVDIDQMYPDYLGYLLTRNPQAAINRIAKYFGIKPSPDDHWEHVRFLNHDPESNLSVYGNAPRYQSEPSYDEEGREIPFNDAAVYITTSAFNVCNYNVFCIAGIMAHEATHSWIEYLITNPNEPNWEPPLEDKEVLNLMEEFFIDTIVRDSKSLVPAAKRLIEMHYEIQSSSCNLSKINCYSAQSYLEGYYRSEDLAVNLDPITIRNRMFGSR